MGKTFASLSVWDEHDAQLNSNVEVALANTDLSWKANPFLPFAGGGVFGSGDNGLSLGLNFHLENLVLSQHQAGFAPLPLHAESWQNETQDLLTGMSANEANSEIQMPITLTDASSYVWDIAPDGSIINGTNDAYDGGLVHVGFANFTTATIEDNGREIAIGPFPLPPLEQSYNVSVTRKIYVPEDQTFARFLEIVTNNGLTPANYTVNINTDLGSNQETVVARTSNNDKVFTTEDNWIVTDDKPVVNDPAMLHVVSGKGGQPPTAVSISGDKLSYSYDLSLQPGETKIVMHFAAQNPYRVTARNLGPQLADLGLNALAGMTVKEQQQVVNFDIVTPEFGEIRGTKWNDFNGNGTRDIGETGLEGGTIYLDQNLNGVLDEGEISTTTDINGDYAFSDLAAGTYTVAEVVQEGWVQTAPPGQLVVVSEEPAPIAMAQEIRETVEPGPEIIHYDYIDENGELNGGSIPLNPTASRNNTLSETPAEILANAATVRNNGPTDNRIDLVFVGDGYTSSELGTYTDNVNNIVSSFFAQSPLDEYSTFFNVHRVDVVSNESGVDGDPTFGILRDTALDMGFWYNGIERLLAVDVNKAMAAAQNAPDVDQILAVANSSKYGGAGYTGNDIGTLSGSNSDGIEIALHEFGHSFADLGDEYESGGPPVYTGPEPSYANVSIYNAETMASLGTKWHQWLNEPDVDTFQGAYYSQQGIYRPTENSKMRTLGQPFGPVNVEQFILSAYKTVRPIDNATPSGIYNPNQVFFVDPVDPLTHALDVQWLLDGTPIAGATSTTFDPSSLGLIFGNHTLEVKVTDNTNLVRDEAMRSQWMTETRSWSLLGLQQGLYQVNLDPGEIVTGIDFGNKLVDPLDDYYEENDSIDKAFVLNEQTWLSSLGSSGVQSDDDWYQINIDPGFEHLVTYLQFSHAQGDIDLAVYDAGGNLVTSSTGVVDNEAIDTILPAPGLYYLKVYYGNAGNSYDLWWDDLSVNYIGNEVLPDTALFA